MLDLVGRFHPVLVHLPIGILLMASLFAFLGSWQRFSHLREVVRFSLLIGALAATFSCLTGYGLSLSGEYELGVLNRHRNLGIAVAVWSLIMFWAYPSKTQQRLRPLLHLVLIGLVFGAGHLGGSLTHGSDYLFQALPEAWRTRLGLAPATAKAERVENLPEANAYAAIVAPLLQEKCVSCHGQTKQKGKLRLDQPDFIAKGGKNGPVLQAGNLATSELIRRIQLPNSDEKHMPPKEKSQLSEAELKLLEWWIASGAHYDKKVKDLPQDEQIKPLLAALSQGGPSATAASKASLWPEVEVPAPDPQAIQALQKVGVVILPLGQNNHLLALNFINLESIDAPTIALLKPLSQQIVSLRFSGVPLEDHHFAQLPALPNLGKLYLDGTRISDASLKRLRQAEHLFYLNLVGTKISVQGLQALKELSHLRELYLYQTPIQGIANWQAARKLLPKVNLDTGGYHVPTLVSDTTLVTEQPK